jgi:hypothetical protein
MLSYYQQKFLVLQAKARKTGNGQEKMKITAETPRTLRFGEI